MKEPESVNIQKALKLCGVAVDLEQSAIIWRVALVVNYKGEKFSIKDVAEIEAEIKRKNERT